MLGRKRLVREYDCVFICVNMYFVGWEGREGMCVLVNVLVCVCMCMYACICVCVYKLIDERGSMCG